MATRNSHHRRHELMPLGGLGKRKDRDVLDAHRGAPVTTKPEPAQATALLSGGGNRLLAGYLAHEFMTRGTLFGQRWDPAAKPPAPGRQESLPALPPKPQQQQKPRQPEPKQEKPPAAYAELAYLLKTDGAHIPGVVNPTQLARLLRM
ncbi:hypothetical protein Taro_003999 [Colocasia esculenta]|uniref:Uncharacterized protein n=1 Tax=Colocasia esculenta TaxID=4460 RepID=A0A843TNA5_COLES|nr:hypothetical protein [Colocasia esculenta]